MTRLLTSSLACLALAILGSCGAMRRAGTDLYVVGASPVRVFTEAAEDTADSTEALELNTAGQIAFTAPIYVYHGIEHVLLAAFHAVDLALFPAYGLYDLTTEKPIEPLEIYADLDLFETAEERRERNENWQRRADELNEDYRRARLERERANGTSPVSSGR